MDSDDKRIGKSTFTQIDCILNKHSKGYIKLAKNEHYILVCLYGAYKHHSYCTENSYETCLNLLEKYCAKERCSCRKLQVN